MRELISNLSVKISAHRQFSFRSSEGRFPNGYCIGLYIWPYKSLPILPSKHELPMKLRFKKHTALQFTLLFLALLWGCKKDFSLVNPSQEPAHFPITVGEAKDWFAKRPVASSLTEAEEKIIVPVIPAWEKAMPGYAQSGKEIIIVPLQGDSLVTKATDSQANVVMLLSKDSVNEVTGQLLMYRADSAYFAAHSNNLSLGDFSGEFLFFDLDYNYKFGCVMGNGVPTEKIDRVTVTMKNEGEAEDRDDSTLDCVPYSIETIYCWRVREYAFDRLDCITWVETFIDCDLIGGGGGSGGGSTGGGGGSTGGTGGGSTGGTGGGGISISTPVPNGPSPQTPPQFAQFISQNMPLEVFNTLNGVLPPGFTPELALQLQALHLQDALSVDEFNHLLVNPTLIPLLLDFCMEFPSDDNSVGTNNQTPVGPNDPQPTIGEGQYCDVFKKIVLDCKLDFAQAKWLGGNKEEFDQINTFLRKHQWDAAAVQTMQWYINSNAKGTFPNFVEDDNLFPISLVYDYALNYIVYKKECQDGNNGVPCSNLHVCWEAIHRTLGGYVHVALDICGFVVPVAGEGCDAINGVLYTLEGDFLNATISYASAIPVSGWFTIGGKYVGLFVKSSNGVTHSLSVTRTAGNIIDFGNRNKLRTVLGITNTANEAHHIIPWELGNHELTQLAAEGKFHMNHPKNGIEVERFRADPGTGLHANHPQYNNKVLQKMDILMENLRDYYGPSSVPSSVAREKLIELEENIRNHINLNPTVKINALTLNGVNIPTVP